MDKIKQVFSSKNNDNSEVSSHHQQHQHNSLAAENVDNTHHQHSVLDRTTHQHSHDNKLPNTNEAQVEADHKHLAPVTKEKVHEHEIEEVQREKTIESHHHHIQHHVQPLVDTKHHDAVHSEKVVPVEKIHETHANTDEDRANFNQLNIHHDSHERGERERSIVDKGENVREEHHHHVHHVVQPIIERDVHKHHVVHTTVPVHQTVHEAPVVHGSTHHAAMKVEDFLAGGVDLKSKLTHDHANVLSSGNCERDIEHDRPSTRSQTANTTGTTNSTGHHANTNTGFEGIGTGTASSSGVTGAGRTDAGRAPSGTNTLERMEHVPAERMNQGTTGTAGVGGFGTQGQGTRI